MRLSIIIPMYGVEKYIEKCLISCIHQDEVKLGEDYEIICINDGSPDKSAEIAKHIANQYKGIRVIDQQNKGLSGARNTGIMNAEGDYIWFVDSDDTIVEGCLKGILLLLTDSLDILHIGHRYVYEDGRPSQDIPMVYKSEFLTGRDAIRRGELATPSPFSILRLKYLINNDLKFMEGIYHEDSEFFPRMAYMAKRIRMYDKICYNYLQRTGGSIMSTVNPKRAYDFIIGAMSLHEFAKSICKDDIRSYNYRIGRSINNALSVIVKTSKEEQRKFAIYLYENKAIFNSLVNNSSLKYRIEGVMFRLMPLKTISIYKLMQIFNSKK